MSKLNASTRLDSELTKSSHVQEQIHEEKLLEQKKLIDFRDLQSNYKASTEQEFPFTTQHIEDVIFVGKKKLISLEYIFYDGREKTQYTKLKKMKPLDDLHDSKGHPDTTYTFNPFCEEFVQKPDYLESKINGNKVEDKSPLNQSAIETHDQKKALRFMKVEDHSSAEKNQPSYVEAIISIWQVTK